MRTDDPQTSFADLEFIRQGVHLDPLLQKISDFIDVHHEPVELVREDLHRGVKRPKTGRKGLTPRQVLCSLILMRYKNWDYRELRERMMLRRRQQTDHKAAVRRDSVRMFRNSGAAAYIAGNARLKKRDRWRGVHCSRLHSQSCGHQFGIRRNEEKLFAQENIPH